MPPFLTPSQGGRSPERRVLEILYLMIKPTAEMAEAIWRQCVALGIDSNYAKERYHITLQPIGDLRHLTPFMMARLIRALQSFEAEPFEIAFKRVEGNALRGGAMPALMMFQRHLIDHLIRAGFPVEDYPFHPHLSLTYGEWQPRSIAIPPIILQAQEVLLVKSLHGLGRHEIVERVPLITRQRPLPL